MVSSFDEKLGASLKRKAQEHLEAQLSQLQHTEWEGILRLDEVLSQLPSQPALVRSLRRGCQEEILGNSTRFLGYTP